MINFIRKIVGKITFPNEVYICEGMDYWTPPKQMPIGFSIGEYDYQYQNIKQNYWGVWEHETCWLGRNEPLPVVIKND